MSDHTNWRAMNELDDDHVRHVCRMGEGADCCRYLTMTPGVGMTCAKLTPLKITIDARVEAGTFTARGDNCDGVE